MWLQQSLLFFIWGLNIEVGFDKKRGEKIQANIEELKKIIVSFHEEERERERVYEQQSVLKKLGNNDPPLSLLSSFSLLSLG